MTKSILILIGGFAVPRDELTVVIYWKNRVKEIPRWSYT